MLGFFNFLDFSLKLWVFNVPRSPESTLYFIYISINDLSGVITSWPSFEKAGDGRGPLFIFVEGTEPFLEIKLGLLRETHKTLP
jgi:hypothetical protein